jgi:hypothetical protein
MSGTRPVFLGAPKMAVRVKKSEKDAICFSVRLVYDLASGELVGVGHDAVELESEDGLLRDIEKGQVAPRTEIGLQVENLVGSARVHGLGVGIVQVATGVARRKVGDEEDVEGIEAGVRRVRKGRVRHLIQVILGQAVFACVEHGKRAPHELLRKGLLRCFLLNSVALNDALERCRVKRNAIPRTKLVLRVGLLGGRDADEGGLADKNVGGRVGRGLGRRIALGHGNSIADREVAGRGGRHGKCSVVFGVGGPRHRDVASDPAACPAPAPLNALGGIRSRYRHSPNEHCRRRNGSGQADAVDSQCIGLVGAKGNALRVRHGNLQLLQGCERALELKPLVVPRNLVKLLGPVLQGKIQLRAIALREDGKGLACRLGRCLLLALCPCWTSWSARR